MPEVRACHCAFVQTHETYDPKRGPNVNSGFRLTMGAAAPGGMSASQNSLYLPLNFAVNLKLVLKSSFNFFKD